MGRDDFERGMEKEQIVMQGMETILRMLEALVKSKKYSDQQKEGFRALLKYARQGGEIRCVVVDWDEFEVLKGLMEKHGVAYGAATFKDVTGEERVNVMYRAEDENRKRVVRAEFVQEKMGRFMEHGQEAVQQAEERGKSVIGGLSGQDAEAGMANQEEREGGGERINFEKHEWSWGNDGLGEQMERKTGKKLAGRGFAEERARAEVQGVAEERTYLEELDEVEEVNVSRKRTASGDRLHERKISENVER